MSTAHSRAHTRSFARLLASCLAVLLAAVAVVASAPAARAATPGINIDFLHNGGVLADGGSIPEGDPFTLRIQYDAQQPIDGLDIVFALPDNIAVTGDLDGNEAIESVTQGEDGTITVRFRAPIPDDITEGALAINLRANPVDGDQETSIDWTIGDDQGGLTFTVEDQVAPPVEIADSYAKSGTPGNLNDFVVTGPSPDYEFVGLAESVEAQLITYTLVLDSSEARTAYAIADSLPAGLGYVADSFAAELTTFNPEQTNDFTFTPAFGDGSFTGSVDVPENSRLVITYQVQVTDVAAIEALLQAQHDALNDRPGDYGTTLTNTATFGGEIERTAGLGFQGHVPGVGVGSAFAKLGDQTRYEVITDEAGQLVEPAQMTYSFEANLTLWDARNDNFTLTDNVVVRDQLIPQAQWLGDAPDFISISGAGPITELTFAGECPPSSATGVGDFAGDEYVGQYCLNGQTLLINLGQDNTTDVTISARAELTTVEGLTEGGSTNIVGATSYVWPNEAQFFHNDGHRHLEWWSANPIALPDERDDGLNDSDAFNKIGPEDDVRVQPGETAQVPYTFRVDTGKESIDPLLSTIVHEVNAEVFDISDLNAIPVGGAYGSQSLDAEHFDLSLNGDGHLVIQLSEAGRTLVGSLPAGDLWIVDVTFTTVPFEGKETFEIYNRATLFGTGDDPTYWSENESEATSFGDEAELRKRVFDDQAAEWTAQLNAPIQDGEFVNDTFVYAIELIPRGNYGSAFPVQIFPREDVLPESVEFLGFVTVDESGVPNLETFAEGPIQVPGNVQVSYTDGVVTFEQAPGTSLDTDAGRIIGYFAVQALDTTGDIVNSIAGSEATITPTGDPSIDVEKWNDEGEAPEYDDAGALVNDGYAGDFDEAPGAALAADQPLPINFTISNDGREDLVDIEVSDQLTAGAGEIRDLVCAFPDGTEGTAWAGPFAIGAQFECVGTLPGLAVGENHADTVTVVGTGTASGTIVDDEDDWHARVPVPSVDIEKWNDEGEVPEYDASGALLNDGYAGDVDTAPGKPLAVDEALPINFTISNDGEEDLIDLVVSDELTSGSGAIEDLVCVFPDGSEGTTWSGPFAVGTQFECTGTLPGLAAGETHADTATVTGVGIDSGVPVDDQDDWHARVPVPSVDIEKWNDEGEAPEYDESGALLNDGFDGDADEAPGALLPADEGTTITFTVSNDGQEALIDVVVSDELTDGSGSIEDLVCVFPDGTEGTTWAGPFAIGTQFDCTGTLPALGEGATHADLASVTAIGADSGTPVGDEDVWHGHTDPAADADGAVGADDGLAGTGVSGTVAALLGALVLIGAGGVALALGRARRQQ